MRFKILSVGRERADPLSPIVNDYLQRIAKSFPIDDLVLKSGRMDRVSERMLKEMDDADLAVALDENGKMFDSIQFSKKIGEWMNRGTGRILFVIGPADGLPKPVRSKADMVLSLSKMTLPHRLARLLIAEQIYRSICIIRGTPYQK